MSRAGAGACSCRWCARGTRWRTCAVAACAGHVPSRSGRGKHARRRAADVTCGVRVQMPKPPAPKTPNAPMWLAKLLASPPDGKAWHLARLLTASLNKKGKRKLKTKYHALFKKGSFVLHAPAQFRHDVVFLLHNHGVYVPTIVRNMALDLELTGVRQAPALQQVDVRARLNAHRLPPGAQAVQDGAHAHIRVFPHCITGPGRGQLRAISRTGKVCERTDGCGCKQRRARGRARCRDRRCRCLRPRRGCLQGCLAGT